MNTAKGKLGDWLVVVVLSGVMLVTVGFTLVAAQGTIGDRVSVLAEVLTIIGLPIALGIFAWNVHTHNIDIKKRLLPADDPKGTQLDAAIESNEEAASQTGPPVRPLQGHAGARSSTQARLTRSHPSQSSASSPNAEPGTQALEETAMQRDFQADAPSVGTLHAGEMTLNLVDPKDVPLRVIWALIGEWERRDLPGRWSISSLTSAAHHDGKGNYSWVLGFADNSRWVVSWGGKKKSAPTVKKVGEDQPEGVTQSNAQRTASPTRRN